jgi:hypothetical protein
MKIIAKRGNSQYLVTSSADTVNPDSQLVDLSKQIATNIPAQQALKWGYWDEPGDVSEEVLKQINDVLHSSQQSNTTKLIALLAK